MTEGYKPRRRRTARDVAAAQVAPEQGAQPSETGESKAEKPTRRRRRANTGGFHLRLAAPQREGYHRRWVNDEPGRLANFEELAYDFVRDPTIKSDGTDTRVRKHVGISKSGQPLYAYLMETPIEEYRAGQADKEEAHAAFEAAINRGEDHTGRMSNSYGRGSIEERSMP